MNRALIVLAFLAGIVVVQLYVSGYFTPVPNKRVPMRMMCTIPIEGKGMKLTMVWDSYNMRIEDGKIVSPEGIYNGFLNELCLIAPIPERRGPMTP